MNKGVIEAVISKWEADAMPDPRCHPTPKNDKEASIAMMCEAKDKAIRETKRECADTLRTLLDMLS